MTKYYCDICKKEINEKENMRIKIEIEYSPKYKTNEWIELYSCNKCRRRFSDKLMNDKVWRKILND